MNQNILWFKGFGSCKNRRIWPDQDPQHWV